jgi:hypothetical protein
MHKNKASNLSQHTTSTIKQKSPPKNLEPTDTLLKSAFMREQQAQQLRQH